MENRTSFIENLNSGINNFDTQDILADPKRLQEIESHWSGLHYLGLELDFTEKDLRCNHQANGFSFSIPYDQADSDELRRELFAELRKYFGSFSDRNLAGIFQPSHQVEDLFTSFRILLTVCTTITRQRTTH